MNENCWLVLGQLLITARKIKKPTNCTHAFGMMMMMLLMMMMMMMMMPRCLLKGMLHLLPVCLFKGGLSWKLRARREFVVGQTNQQFQDNTFRAATDSLPRIHSKAAADDIKTVLFFLPLAFPVSLWWPVVKPWIMHSQATGFGTAVWWLNRVGSLAWQDSHGGLVGQWMASS